MKRFTVLLMLICVLLSSSYRAAATTPANSSSNAAATAKPEAELVLDQMEEVGRKMTTLVAKLSQQKTNSQLGIKEQEEVGEIHYVPAKNGAMKLRIDITKPAARTIVINGDEVKFYEREVHQMLVTSLKNRTKTKSFGSLAITFGSVAAIRANYNVSYLKDEKIGTENAAVLHLIPKESGPYKEIDIWISRTIGLPLQQRFTEKNGDILVMRLSDMKMNERFNVKNLIDDFKPSDAKVVKD